MAKKYAREAIIKSKRFAEYQRDFLAVILSKPEYTLAEATRVVKAFFNGKEARK